MAEATRRRLFTGGPRRRGGAQETTEPGQVLLVFGQQHRDQPVRWDYSDETAATVNDGQGRLAVMHGPPRGNLLVDAGADRRGAVVHHRLDTRFAGRGQGILDSQHAAK